MINALRRVLPLPHARRGAGHVSVGRRGQRVAERALRRCGHRVLARNLRTSAAEIDLLCLDRRSGQIALVEVKTRAGASEDPPPEANLSGDQRARLLRAATLLARDTRINGRPIRIDLVTVRLLPGGNTDVRHHRAAIRG